MAQNPGNGPSPFNIDMTKLFGDMKFPAMPDMGAFAAAQQRNVEALSSASKLAMEAAHTVAQRHMEITQKAVADMTAGIQALAGPEAPQAKAAKQAELVKQAYTNAVANLKELGELIQHANAEAVQVLNARFTEALDEIKTLADKSGKS